MPSLTDPELNVVQRGVRREVRRWRSARPNEIIGEVVLRLLTRLTRCRPTNRNAWLYATARAETRNVLAAERHEVIQQVRESQLCASD